jgi:hypothetical protein
VSPTGRYVTIVPFCAILALTALKEIVEDLKRHQADRKVNHSEVEVLTAAGTTFKKWKDVRVGDIIRVVNEKYFPADLILLSSSEPAGTSFFSNFRQCCGSALFSMRIRIQIQHFCQCGSGSRCMVLMTKSWKKFRAKIFFIFLIKNCNLLFLRLP